MALCIWAGSVLLATLPVSGFTLAWTHTIERIVWEEDWQVSPAGLQIVAARIRGAGAGMEPPEGASLRNGVWHFRPRVGTVAEIVLANSEFGDDYRICVEGSCTALKEIARTAGTAGIEESVKFVSCSHRHDDN